jgi:hypothetical protein
MQNMSRLLDIMGRAVSGPICDEKELNLKHVASGVAGIVMKYDFHLDLAILGLRRRIVHKTAQATV